MPSYNQMILVVVFLVYLGTEYIDGKSLSRRIRNGVIVDDNSQQLSEAKALALEKASIRIMHTLRRLETDPEMKREITSFIHKANRIRQRRYAEYEYTRDIVKVLDSEAKNKFVNKMNERKFGQEQTDCFNSALSQINQPEFVSLLAKC